MDDMDNIRLLLENRQNQKCLTSIASYINAEYLDLNITKGN